LVRYTRAWALSCSRKTRSKENVGFVEYSVRGLGPDELAAIFICPTYDLLNAFPGASFKVRFQRAVRLSILTQIQAEFAIPPGLHANDVLYYWPSIFPPAYQNTAFINAFAQIFTSFAISLDPNVKIDPATITPHWNKWDVDHTEMLFNKTDADVPVVKPMTTSNALLERCQCVLFILHSRIC
jgi:hypothetical protein